MTPVFTLKLSKVNKFVESSHYQQSYYLLR